MENGSEELAPAQGIDSVNLGIEGSESLPSPPNDAPRLWEGLISFLIPPIGFALLCSLIGDAPKRTKAISRSSAIGFALDMLAIIAFYGYALRSFL